MPLDFLVHPREQIHVWAWKDDPLEEKWKGPYQVLLAMSTAVKLGGPEPWIPCQRVKTPTGLWTPKGMWKLPLKRN